MIILVLFSLLGVLTGGFLVKKPDSAIEIQRRFYERINWKIEPVSMAKELRNTRIMGGFLVMVSILIFFLSVLLMFNMRASAQETLEDEAVDSGLESVSIGPAATLLVPKGTKVENKKGVISVESNAEFSARKFQYIDRRFDSLEQAQQQFDSRLEELEEQVAILAKNKEVPK